MLHAWSKSECTVIMHVVLHTLDLIRPHKEILLVSQALPLPF